MTARAARTDLGGGGADVDVAERFSVATDDDTAWRVITDVPTVLACVPGISGISRRDDGSYQATIAASLGPLRLEFSGTVRCEFHEEERRAVVLAKGRDRSGTTQVASEVEVRLQRDQRHGETVVEISGQIEFGGALAAAARAGGKVVADRLVRGLAEGLAARMSTER